MLLHQALRAAEAGGHDAGAGVFLEALGVEHAALAAVEGEHRRIERDAGKRAVDHGARDAGALRVARYAGEEAVEIAAAWRRRGRRGEAQGEEKSHQPLREQAVTTIVPRGRLCHRRSSPGRSFPRKRQASPLSASC